MALRPGPAEPFLRAIELRDLALDRIRQGLCVFNGEQRLMLFNRRYAEMYDLDPRDLWIGMTLREVIDMRYAAGSGPDMSAAEYASWRDRIGGASRATETEVVLLNGAVHAIHHEPIAGGGWVATFDDITGRRRAEERVRHMAHHDPLTDLPNRALFADRLERAVARFRGEEQLEDHYCDLTGDDRVLALLLLDLDHFKSVNDSLGHASGDELLRQVARRIESCLRPMDTLARLGGDEFAIMLDYGVVTVAQVVAVAERVIHVVSEPYVLDGHEAMIGISIGVTWCATGDGDATPVALLRQADVALYRAKGQHRGRCCVFEVGMASGPR